MTQERSPFSVAEYQRMIEVGILTSEDKVELLENYIVLRMPRSPRHNFSVQVMMDQILTLCPAGWSLRVLGSVTLSDSQPEPDFAIVRGNKRSYFTRHPGPDDVGLLIEVADASLLLDQLNKTRIYARANIPYY